MNIGNSPAANPTMTDVVSRLAKAVENQRRMLSDAAQTRMALRGSAPESAEKSPPSQPSSGLVYDLHELLDRLGELQAAHDHEQRTVLGVLGCNPPSLSDNLSSSAQGGLSNPVYQNRR